MTIFLVSLYSLLLEWRMGGGSGWKQIPGGKLGDAERKGALFL
jgi:hypothetical protein